MKKFEYNAINYSYSDEYIQKMDKQGERGWEVIQVIDTGTGYYVFFKREFAISVDKVVL